MLAVTHLKHKWVTYRWHFTRHRQQDLGPALTTYLPFVVLVVKLYSRLQIHELLQITSVEWHSFICSGIYQDDTSSMCPFLQVHLIVLLDNIIIPGKLVVDLNQANCHSVTRFVFYLNNHRVYFL